MLKYYHTLYYANTILALTVSIERNDMNIYCKLNITNQIGYNIYNTQKRQNIQSFYFIYKFMY